MNLLRDLTPIEILLVFCAAWIGVAALLAVVMSKVFSWLNTNDDENG